jgi:CDP-glycerol glycerophosphotransferase (TagB/SpsB family)
MKSQLLLVSKSIYIYLIKITSRIFKKKNTNIIFLLSFPTTSDYILRELYNEFGSRIIICYTKNCFELANQYKNLGCKIISLDRIIQLLFQAIPVISGSRIILCDNYYAFLGGINFHNDTEVIQLWHANGAIKLFGLEAKYSKQVSKFDKKRYLKVYEKFTRYVVSSKKMAHIFEKNYKVPISILPFGYLPTDFFFNSGAINEAKKIFEEKFGYNKKVLLYAPTYRENKTTYPLDFDNLSTKLNDEWLIFVKAHPHDEELISNISNKKNIVTDFKGLNLQQILVSTDCLVTDYSSIPFEYSLANQSGRLLFFCYDLEEYQQNVGLENDFMNQFSEQIFLTEKELITEINNIKTTDFTQFNQIWNEFSNGNSSDQLIEWMKHQYEDRKNHGNSRGQSYL